MPERVLANGVRLHWREAGDPAKPPLIWIHGGSVEDSSVMLPDLEPFFDRVRALCPDTRGHGLSSTFERAEDYGYARKGQDMLLWLDALGLERAVWGGASMGAALSLWIAAHAGARAGGDLDQRPAVRAAAGGHRLVARAPAAGRGRTLRRLLRRQRAAAHG